MYLRFPAGGWLVLALLLVSSLLCRLSRVESLWLLSVSFCWGFWGCFELHSVAQCCARVVLLSLVWLVFPRILGFVFFVPGFRLLPRFLRRWRRDSGKLCFLWGRLPWLCRRRGYPSRFCLSRRLRCIWMWNSSPAVLLSQWLLTTDNQPAGLLGIPRG